MMEELLFTTKNPIQIAREKYYGLDTRSVVFSYAEPHVLEAARLEALQERIEKQIESTLGKRKESKQKQKQKQQQL